MTALPVRLTGREIHVWLADPDRLADPAIEARCLELLDDAEAKRNERMLVTSARREFLVGRWLVRRGLSRYVDVDPRDWSFEENEHGRPSVGAPALADDLRFNLSHTRGLAALVVAVGREVGVDVEAVDRSLDLVPIARRKFAPPEAERVVGAAETEQVERFFRYWTLKEAFLKAKGVGLSLGLDRFWFTFPEEGCVEAEFAPALGDRPDRWRFSLLRVSRRHRLALALESLDASAVVTRFGWLEPGGEVRLARLDEIARSTNWRSDDAQPSDAVSSRDR